MPLLDALASAYNRRVA
jgi:hypothetical protein